MLREKKMALGASPSSSHTLSSALRHLPRPLGPTCSPHPSPNRFQPLASSRLPGTAPPSSRSWCFLNPSCCTEFTCPIILVYFHLVFSDTSPTPSSKIRFFRCVLYIYYSSAFNIICWNYKRASFGGETVKAH